MSEYLLILPKATLENLFFGDMNKIYVLGAYGKRGHSHKTFFIKGKQTYLKGNMYPGR